MNVSNLETKWLTLDSEGDGIKALRVDATCIPDLFIGVDNQNNRCLILKVPSSFDIDFIAVFKENLSIEPLHNDNWIIIKLIQPYFYDLFNDLIISLYNKIVGVSEVGMYVKEFLHTFYKWSEFFEEGNSGRLKEETIKGLFGELIVLKELIIQSDSNKLNALLNSWKGPYDLGHDFILEEKGIEVKTKLGSNLDIRISSEFQLEEELGKSLELAVVNIESDYIEGVSIRELLNRVKLQVIEKFGDFVIVLNALKQKGLLLSNIAEYDNYKYRAENIIYYNCLADGFPKITRQQLTPTLTKVRYSIRVSLLNEFIISQIIL